MSRILLFAGIATITIAEANYISRILTEHGRLMQESEATALEPIVGRNLLSVLLTDIVNIFLDPSWASLMAGFVDITSFFALPLLGGYVNASVQYNY